MSFFSFRSLIESITKTTNWIFWVREKILESREKAICTACDVRSADRKLLKPIIGPLSCTGKGKIKKTCAIAAPQAISALRPAFAITLYRLEARTARKLAYCAPFSSVRDFLHDVKWRSGIWKISLEQENSSILTQIVSASACRCSADPCSLEWARKKYMEFDHKSSVQSIGS